jgi:hypothetical protein
VKNPAIAADARGIVKAIIPEVKKAVQGKAVTIRQVQLDGMISLLNAIGSEASPDLKLSIQKIKQDIRQREKLNKINIKVNR